MNHTIKAVRRNSLHTLLLDYKTRGEAGSEGRCAAMWEVMIQILINTKYFHFLGLCEDSGFGISPKDTSNIEIKIINHIINTQPTV